MVAVIGLMLIIATPMKTHLTSTMVTHLLIQIPLLVAIGFVFGQRIDRRFEPTLRCWNAGGIPGILLVSFTLGFWMIPRWLDHSLTDSWVEYAKNGSLVVAGTALAVSWKRLHPIARGVVKIECLSMLFRFGWLFLISPQRLCTSYLLSDQIWLGRGMILVAIALGITWMIPVFFGGFAPNRPYWAASKEIG